VAQVSVMTRLLPLWPGFITGRGREGIYLHHHI